MVCSKRSGSVAEWSIALVLKTSNGKPFVSSNLTASAIPRTQCAVGVLSNQSYSRCGLVVILQQGASLYLPRKIKILLLQVT